MGLTKICIYYTKRYSHNRSTQVKHLEITIILQKHFCTGVWAFKWWKIISSLENTLFKNVMSFTTELSWSWNSNTLATWCEQLTHWKRPRCWERLRAGGEGDDRGWDGWMASPTWWTWVWVNSGNWWWTGRPGVLRFMGLQRVGHDWATELTWITEWSLRKRTSFPAPSLC